MNFQSRIENFIKKPSKTNKEIYYEIAYLCSKEFGWTYNELMISPIPYILELLKIHKKVKEAEAKAAKKR